jgi:hypothetical protein
MARLKPWMSSCSNGRVLPKREHSAHYSSNSKSKGSG